MKHGKFLAAALVGAVGVAAIAQASSERGPGRAPGMGMMNAPVDVSQVLERHSERFAQADANGNGRLDLDELNAAIARMRAERRMQHLDANGDGAVSSEEFSQPLRERLHRMDRNDDSTIDRGELHAGRDRHGKHGDRDCDDDHGRDW